MGAWSSSKAPSEPVVAFRRKGGIGSLEGDFGVGDGPVLRIVNHSMNGGEDGGLSGDGCGHEQRCGQERKTHKGTNLLRQFSDVSSQLSVSRDQRFVEIWPGSQTVFARAVGAMIISPALQRWVSARNIQPESRRDGTKSAQNTSFAEMCFQPRVEAGGPRPAWLRRGVRRAVLRRAMNARACAIRSGRAGAAAMASMDAREGRP